MSSICPSNEDLQAFVVGKLSDLRFSHVAEHVANCPACDASLESLDGLCDDLVSGLFSLGKQPLVEQEPVPERVLALARSAQSTTDGQGDVTFDPGRRYARKLAEGPCRVGRFELQAELGDGSFGYVFRARDLELDRIVAVKIQRAGNFASDEEMQRFLREARSSAQLQHSGIVSLYDSGQTDDGVCFLVTEYIAGDTLEARLQKGSLSPREAADLIAELAATLQYAHDHGVVHRDVKPSNVILDDDGHPHITDFGLAKRLVGDQTMTSDGRVMGTPAYMSPEQARGESHDVDARGDVYSLGVMLYELLTGERPFQGNRRLLLLQVLEDEPRPPRRLKDQIPRELETICLKAMAKSPARRYQTAGELADDLRRFLDGEPILARPMGAGERLWRWCRQNPLATGLLLAVTVGASIGFWYLSHLSTYFVQESALDSVRMEADMLERINDYYSEEVLGGLNAKRHDLEITHEYALRDDALPLPKTFMIDAGDRISRGTTGMKVRLYSGYPWRKDGGAKDQFEKDALEVLREKVILSESDLSYHQFTDQTGRPVVRFAKVQIMKEGCVKCHNDNKASPKKDWQVGDLAGVLSITRPLDRDIERTRSGMGGAFALVGGVGLLLVGVSLALVFASRYRAQRKSGA